MGRNPRSPKSRWQIIQKGIQSGNLETGLFVRDFPSAYHVAIAPQLEAGINGHGIL